MFKSLHYDYEKSSLVLTDSCFIETIQIAPCHTASVNACVALIKAYERRNLNVNFNLSLYYAWSNYGNIETHRVHIEKYYPEVKLKKHHFSQIMSRRKITHQLLSNIKTIKC